MAPGGPGRAGGPLVLLVGCSYVYLPLIAPLGLRPATSNRGPARVAAPPATRFEMRLPSRLGHAVLLIVCASAASPAQGQAAVTATSGNPDAIARIRTEFAQIEREAPGYRQTTQDVFEFSPEGGVLTGFYRGSELRKLHARLFGETWQGTEEYYFAGGQLIFIHVVHGVYDEPMSGRVRRTIEHRFYFDGGRLIRRIRTVSPAASGAEDLSMYDPELPVLLRTAELFAACAAAAGDDPPECTAPESILQ